MQEETKNELKAALNICYKNVTETEDGLKLNKKELTMGDLLVFTSPTVRAMAQVSVKRSGTGLVVLFEEKEVGSL